MTGAALSELTQATLLALGGVAVAAVIVRAFGREQPVNITADVVRAELAHAFPAFRPATVLRDHPDGRTALVLDRAASHLAAVFTFGTMLTSRCVPVADAVLEVSSARVTVRLADMVTPDITLRLPLQVPQEFARLFARSHTSS